MKSWKVGSGRSTSYSSTARPCWRATAHHVHEGGEDSRDEWAGMIAVERQDGDRAAGQDGIHRLTFSGRSRALGGKIISLRGVLCQQVIDACSPSMLGRNIPRYV